MRNCHAVSHSNYMILHFYQQFARVLLSLHLHQHLLFSGLVDNSIIVNVRQYLSVALISISLMTSDADHLFMYFLAVCIYSLEKCLFKFFVHCLISLIFLLWMMCRSSLYVLDIIFSKMTCKYFLTLCGLPFTLFASVL